jgi:DNA replication protein DnaC
VKLFRFLLAGRADHSWEKRTRKYFQLNLLIIDEFGLAAMTQAQAEDFYEIVSERHLNSSLIITSNRLPQDCIALFSDPAMGDSALDRLSHHAYLQIVEGKSYRKKVKPLQTLKGELTVILGTYPTKIP